MKRAPVAPGEVAGASGGQRREAAVVLAGGDSRRMGEEKALLDAGGVSVVERLVALLSARFERLYISVRHGGPSSGLAGALTRAADAAGRPLTAVADSRPGLGPLEGVRAALAALGPAPAFFIAVDLPEVCWPLVEALWERGAARPSLGCVPRWRRGVEPAYGVYSGALLAPVEALIAGGRHSLQEVAGLEGVELLDLEDAAAARRLFGGGLSPQLLGARLEALFRNLNTPEEYQRWQANVRR